MIMDEQLKELCGNELCKNIETVLLAGAEQEKALHEKLRDAIVEAYETGCRHGAVICKTKGDCDKKEVCEELGLLFHDYQRVENVLERISSLADTIKKSIQDKDQEDDYYREIQLLEILSDNLATETLNSMFETKQRVDNLLSKEKRITTV